jgi:hypothetical protein
MSTKKMTIQKHPNGLGISGYDFSCRTHFDTMCRGKAGIAVTLRAVGGPRRYMVVTGCTTHEGAYEIARVLAPVDGD